MLMQVYRLFSVQINVLYTLSIASVHLSVIYILFTVQNGDTALHIASAMGRRKLTRILLEIGINPALRNKQGETALDIALRKNLAEIVSILQVGVPPPRPPADPSLAARPSGGRLPDPATAANPAEAFRRVGGPINGLPTLSDCERIEPADGGGGFGGGGAYQHRSTGGKAATVKRPVRQNHSVTTATESTQHSTHMGKTHRHVR